jgi:GNAT acetyltransferase-like protein
MGKKVIFKKSSEFSVSEIKQIRDVFLSVFKKEMTQESFEKRFLNSADGYSYHGLLLDNDLIVGSFSAIPFRYRYFGKELTFALSVDTMILKEHRGKPSSLPKMAEFVYQALVEDGIPFIYGFPNELYYSHEKRLMGTTDIGRLYYYILPLNIGAIFPKMKYCKFLSQSFARTFMALNRISANGDFEYNIEKVNDEIFDRSRYDESYSFLDIDGKGRCVYKIHDEDGVKTLHILDVSPLSPEFFQKAVQQVYQIASREIDAILYVGTLPFYPRGLIKVLRFMEPQRIMMTGKVLMPEIVDESAFVIDNWNVNVSNFDVR